MRTAFQGEPGAFSEAAALRFHPGADVMPCPAFEDVFAAVEEGRARTGVVPIENSVGGSIHRNYDLLVAHELRIIGEVELPVVHNLAALPGTRLEAVKQVYSHPQALAQCDRFLRGLAGVEVVATYDTAGSARLIRDRGLTATAAIASARAAEIFGLEILQAGIQDYADNVTRFLVLGRSRPGDGALHVAHANKTSVCFSLPNEPGSLFKALSVFALRGIDLTKLESRPVPGRPWEYRFHADLSVGGQDMRCTRALMHLAEFATSLRTLGSYRAVERESVTDPATAPGQVTER